MSPHPQNLIWIDLEMTGLNPLKDRIIEIATLVTDKDLKILAEGPELVIHQPQAVLDGMDEWNRTHHGQSGLMARVVESSLKAQEAERETLDFLAQWVPQGASPICGNSICQDRRFLASGMPHLEAYFHYRNLDVSTLKELTSRWAPHLMAGFTKRGNHRALDDVRESIAELLYYRQHVLKI
ncbi:MAG: oligoribonuclease [Methylococcus sp.]|jgi:oligoribonuclease|nr:MAG: oligoribonuclease [Methylococcus sp.]